jgi:hypothetical protein
MEEVVPFLATLELVVAMHKRKVFVLVLVLVHFEGFEHLFICNKLDHQFILAKDRRGGTPRQYS